MLLENLKTILDDCCQPLKIDTPSSYVNSNDVDAKELVGYAIAEGRDLLISHDWSNLKRSHSFDLKVGQPNYALPVDYARQITNTHWLSNIQRRSNSPLTTQEYQDRVRSYETTNPYYQLHVSGWNNKQIQIYPTPAEAETFSFWYISNHWIIPKKIEIGKVVTQGEHVTIDIDNVATRFTVKTTETVRSETVLPTTVFFGDGPVILEYYDSVNTSLKYNPSTFDYGYTRFNADTDIPLFDAELMRLGIILRALSDSALDTSVYQGQYTKRLLQIKGDLSGASTINMNCHKNSHLGLGTIPDGGWNI